MLGIVIGIAAVLASVSVGEGANQQKKPWNSRGVP
jgi:ABC-type antimicrobial peptide transport system permease subunit